MATYKPIYSHGDDDPHLTGDALAGKVLRFLRYATILDTSDISVFAIGSIVMLSGTVAKEADIASAGKAAASVIGVAAVDNELTVRGEGAEE